MATELLRKDRRQPGELRAREARFEEYTQYDGSAWCSNGATSVFAGISGPRAVRPAIEKFDRATITVNVHRATLEPMGGGASKMLADDTRQTQQREDADLMSLIKTTAEAVVLVEEAPRSCYEISVRIVTDDGSARAVAVNAVVCALLDAAVPCRTTVAAATVALVPPSALTTKAGGAVTTPLTATSTRDGVASVSAQQLITVVDPTLEEESVALASGVFVFNLPACGGGLIASQSWHGGAGINNSTSTASEEPEVTKGRMVEGETGAEGNAVKPVVSFGVEEYMSMQETAEAAAGLAFKSFRSWFSTEE